MPVRACVAVVLMLATGTVSPQSAGHVVQGTVAVASASPDLSDPRTYRIRPAATVARPSARRRAPRPAATAVPHGPCPAYATVLVPGSVWLSGRGVDVMSNGGTGPTCYSVAAGHRWQCGELVNRFLAARGWSPAIPGDAGGFFDAASPVFFQKHAIGSGYLPVPGDIVVWRGGAIDPSTGTGYGHVAIVVAAAGGYLTIVEQNSTLTGFGRIPIDASGTLGPAGALEAVGYLHAVANPQHATPTAAPHTPVPTPTPRPPAVHQGRPSSAPSPLPTPVAATGSASATPTPSPTPTAASTPATPSPSTGP